MIAGMPVGHSECHQVEEFLLGLANRLLEEFLESAGLLQKMAHFQSSIETEPGL